MNITDVGAFQRARKLETRVRVLSAWEAIEQEIIDQGSYSHNNGRVTLKEVARRAGLSSTTLRNAHHRDTRDLILSKIISLGTHKSIGKASKDSLMRDKIEFYEDALKRMNDEAIRWRIELKTLRDENRKLRERIQSLDDVNKVVKIRS